jgi:long-chain fatty acid transport protein
VNIISAGVGVLCKEHGSFFGLMRCGDLGIGTLKPKAIGVDLSYQAALYEQRTISGNTGVRTPVNGVYSSTFHTGSVAIRVLY